jgi:hypothetical protein
MAGLQYIVLNFCVKKFNILTVSQNRDSIFIPLSIIMFRLITTLTVSMPPPIRIDLQESILRQEDTEDRKQMTACDELPSACSGPEPVEGSRVEGKGQSVSVFGHPTSVICHLLSDKRET